MLWTSIVSYFTARVVKEYSDTSEAERIRWKQAVMEELVALKTVKKAVHKRFVDLKDRTAEVKEHCKNEVLALEKLKARTDALSGFGELWVKDQIPCSAWLRKICELRLDANH